MKLTRRKQFKFYRSYFDVYNELSNKDKVIFMNALLDKQFLNVDPEGLTGMVKIAWLSLYHSIDTQVKGYETKTGNLLNPHEQRGSDPMQGGIKGGTQGPTLQEEEKEKEEVKVKEKVEDIKIFFNTVCKDLPKIHKISDQRLKLINSRAEEYDFETIGNVFHIVAKSDFLNGKNKNNWTASFDWILNKTNFLKILEGNYNNKENGQKQSNKTVSDEQLAEILYRNLGDQKEK